MIDWSWIDSVFNLLGQISDRSFALIIVCEIMFLHCKNRAWKDCNFKRIFVLNCIDLIEKRIGKTDMANLKYLKNTILGRIKGGF